MQCPECSEQNPEGATFCMNCATRLVLVCDQCGTELPAQARFCFNCAAPVGAPPVGAPPVGAPPVGAPPVGAPPADAPLPPLGSIASDSAAERLGRLVPREFAERLLATRGQVSRERRTVTILFSDIKGSTSMAENLDPEDVMEIMDGAFEVLIEPVTRYEGTLARLMGDAVLAFFGAPIAHEDDPERACRAALEITAEAQRYAERLKRERGIEGFNVRVGINTGLVVVGEVGSDLRVEYTAMGDAVNLAARMESAAAPGTVLITEATHKLIAPLFDTESLGLIEVKGKTEPVAVYRVLAAKAEAGKLRGIAGLESPLVGREAELAALREAAEHLQAGVGGVVTVVGEAGIGKSRLVAEVQSSAQGDGPVHLTWVEGRCLSYGASIAYLLWLDILRGVLDVSVEEPPVAVRDELRRLVQTLYPDHGDELFPYLARMMSLPLEAGEKALLKDLDGGQLKAHTFQAVERLLEAVSRDRPLVLVLEDLHWADPTSIELLAHLLPLTDRASLLLICIFRPRRECGCWQIREAAARDYPHRHRDVWLECLSSAESEVLVINLLQVEGIPPWFRKKILSVTEGNPFFVEEVLRGLIDQGVVVANGATGRWQVAEGAATVQLPDTLQSALVARIDRLQEDTKRILQMAAVIGRIFLYRVLEAIAAAKAAVEEWELDQRLLTLQREEMIRERARLPELEYIFKHELTREAAYNGLLKSERRAFHRQVAGALERLFPERVEEQVGLLAYHWEQAGDPEKATEYLLRAGDQARLAYAHQEAVDYYQRALTILKEGEEHERAARTLMKLGLTYHNAFQFQRARQAYEEGFALWRRAGQRRDHEPPAPAPHALRIACDRLPTLDPNIADGNSYSLYVRDQLFSALVELTPEMDVVPDVTRRWEVSEGGRRYVFHLRDDIVWSDGVPVTAGDFEYACKRLLDPARDDSAGDLLYDIRGARAYHQGQVTDADQVGVRALDELTLVVELERPASYFLHLLPSLLPLPQHAVEAHGEAWTELGHLVTNGPFRLEAWNQSESMILIRSPQYHRRFTGNVERVQVSSISQDAAPALRLYAADGLDVLDITRFPQAEGDRARQRHAGEHVAIPPLVTVFAEFDASRPPFDDRRVRQALIMAADRETLADVAPGGAYYFPTTGGFVPPRMPGHSAGLGLPYDPEQARQLLAEAGYPAERGVPIVDAVTVPQAKPVAEHLRGQWQENLGVEITWDYMKFEMFPDRLERKPPHMHMFGWTADYPDPHCYLGLWLHSTKWQNEAYEELVEKAGRVMDQGERMRLYQEADRLLMEEAPIMPVFHVPRLLLVKPWVSACPLSGIATWSWKDIIIEPH